MRVCVWVCACVRVCASVQWCNACLLQEGVAQVNPLALVGDRIGDRARARRHRPVEKLQVGAVLAKSPEGNHLQQVVGKSKPRTFNMDILYIHIYICKDRYRYRYRCDIDLDLDIDI